MADTRKDKRAPISLKVRFKSATVDEFIEQYSVDISRGGIFIKSKTPMSVGTLLKFEFRLKDESRLIHGVGRVIWKREEDGGDERPPGMGIKFIKMDPESRALVDQAVAKRGDAPGRYEEGQDDEDVVASAPAASFFPSTTPQSELPPPEDRTQVRHASEFLASALAEGASESASKEAEKRAAEARKRTEEIEKQRAEAAKQQARKPRIKKTLVGVGVPDVETSGEAPTVEAAPIATSKAAAVDTAVDDVVEKAAEKAFDEPPRQRAKLVDVSESAETKAIDREELEAAKALTIEPAKEEPAKPAEPEPKAEAKAPPKPEPKPEPKAEAKVEVDADAVQAKPKDEPKPKPAPKAAEPKSEPPPKKEERRPVALPPAAAQPEEPSSKMPMIAIGLILLLGIGGFAAWQMGLFGGGQTTTPPPPISGQPTPAPAPDPEPGGGPPRAPPPDPAAVAPTEPEPAAAEPEPEPAVPTVTVQVTTTPPGATVLVGGAERGTSPLSVDLPIGQATTVAARLAGHVEATQEVTATERQAPLRMTLQRMPYVIRVVTDPPGAVVRGPGTVTAPGDLTLRAAPTAPVSLTASMRGYDNAVGSVAPADFAESEGRMVASVTLTLNRAAAPTPPAGGGAGRVRPAGGGETEGGGETSAPAGNEGGGGGGGGGGERAAPEPAPAPAPEPPRPPPPAPSGGGDTPAENPF
jgi:uncharacterized protein (TIGR02266 family)